ncbi:MAG TPA: polyphosphate:AMP phosphotransferase [Gammaproteobacteria bacterium]|jgi:polyphosphate:AMP phosphotransferase|nr:polyphosphate:AMP phosphotransferase [Gammaproteobacteria bacterium]
MFEVAELGNKISSEEYDKEESRLREELLQLQQDLRLAKFPVIVVFAGVDGAGKGETVNRLSSWMDPRWLVTNAYSDPSDEESERPEFWRYWRDLPPKGQIGMFLSAWYSKPVVDHAWGRIGTPEFDEQLARIQGFEKELAADGALIIKFWMHLGKSQQKKRLKKLENDPHQAWRVTDNDWRNWKNYDGFIRTAERTILNTSSGENAWTIVEGEQSRYREITVARHIRDAVRQHLKTWDIEQKVVAEALKKRAEEKQEKDSQIVDPKQVQIVPAPTRTILSTLDMTQQLERPDYKTQLKKQQSRLNRLYREAKARGISSMLVFEGWDAAGKGGAIRRLTAAMDSRDYRVLPFAAPTDEENAHHYLWRFWRHLSRAGKVSIFDRSWYGRVLVERIEGFARNHEWQRAYAEINSFEEQLVEHGIVLMKYWVHITPEEQLERFGEREKIPYKRWKLTDGDWRNRAQWGAYEMAVHEMIERTSTRNAPWTLVEGNNKYFARVKIIESYCKQLEKTLGINANDKDD